MTVSGVIHPGDKIDICMVQKIEAAERMEKEPKVYKSKVLGVKEDGVLEIAMPYEKAKMVVLPLDMRFEAIFYTKSGMYRGIVQSQERYKKENLYMLKVVLKTGIEKFQRREFYRYTCAQDVKFYELTEEQEDMDSEKEILSDFERKHLFETVEKGTLVDLSGGGARIILERSIKPGKALLFDVELKNEEMEKQYYIVGTVVSCERTETGGEDKIEARIQFLIRDNRVREDIIRYIFTEERRRSRRRG